MFCDHLVSFLCPGVPSPLCFFCSYTLALPTCLFSLSPHPGFLLPPRLWPKWLPTRTQRKPALSEPAVLPLSASTMIHQWPLPFALDGLLEEAVTLPRKDLSDSAVNNLALIHQSLKSSTLLCPTLRLSSCNPSAGYFGRLVRAESRQKFDSSRRK